METRSGKKHPQSEKASKVAPDTTTSSESESKKRRNRRNHYRRKAAPLNQNSTPVPSPAAVPEVNFNAQVMEEKAGLQSTAQEESSKKEVIADEQQDVKAGVALLPTYKELDAACEEAKSKELIKHGKGNVITLQQLHEPRRTQLLLIEVIRDHLNDKFKADELKARNANELNAILDEKRDILAGAMFFVRKQIYGTYWFTSADKSLVHNKYRAALDAFDFDSTNKAVIAFARFFIVNDLPADKAKPVGGYTIEAVKRTIPEYEASERKAAEAMQAEKEAASPRSKSSGGSLVSYLTFGLLGSSHKHATSAAKEKEVSPAVDEKTPSFGM